LVNRSVFIYFSWFGATNYAYHLGLKLTKAIPASLIAILAVFGIVVGFGIDTRRLDIASIQGGFPPFTYQYIQSGNLRIFICSDYGWSWIN
jgi:MFS superfamily sulfate permease-like transporter